MNERDSVVDAQPRIYSRDEHIISRKNIDPDALKIMYRLNRYGYKAYLVGGGVRDLLLNKAPKDFDIATDATPRQIKGLFRNSRIIGRRFKLIHVFFRGGKIIEVSTFRDFHGEDESNQEGQPISRDNIYGTESTDAFRRDLTINGLFYTSDNFTIIDYVGGMEDLEQKIIHMIGDPDVRLPEDPVRLMRVVRHAVKAGFKIDSKLEEALIKHSQLIDNCASMRVYEELRKDFASGHSLDILRGLKDYSILQYLLPELCEDDQKLAEGSCLSNSITQLDNLVSGEGEVSTTSYLSVLTLMNSLDPSTDLSNPEILPDKEEIKRITKESFKSLAIPRKERERVEKTILLWKIVLESPIEKLKPQTLANRAAVEDLAVIAKALYQEIDPDLYYLLESSAALRAKRPKSKRRFSSNKRSSGNKRSGRGKGRGKRRTQRRRK